jgi:hypothetical protein
LHIPQSQERLIELGEARPRATMLGLESKRARRGLDALRDVGIIEQPREREWVVGDPLLRRYLARR